MTVGIRALLKSLWPFKSDESGKPVRIRVRRGEHAGAEGYCREWQRFNNGGDGSGMVPVYLEGQSHDVHLQFEDIEVI